MDVIESYVADSRRYMLVAVSWHDYVAYATAVARFSLTWNFLA